MNPIVLAILSFYGGVFFTLCLLALLRSAADAARRRSAEEEMRVYGSGRARLRAMGRR